MPQRDRTRKLETEIDIWKISYLKETTNNKTQRSFFDKLTCSSAEFGKPAKSKRETGFKKAKGDFIR